MSVKKLILSFVLLMSTQSVVATVSQYPLFLVNSVDPNVLFNMSVETPMGGAAYNDQPDGAGCGGRVNDGGTVGVCYDNTKTYLGYFDPKKCYEYSNNRFNPKAAANSLHECSGQFSGNMMNWATMTAMDMFVWTMTGGNRVDDGADNTTVIRRVRKQNNDDWFPHKLLIASRNVAPSTVTPWSDSKVYIYNTSFGVRFGTSRGGNQKSGGDYNVKIRVCDHVNSTIEDNCIPYDGGNYYKPEGLIHKNAESMRFAVTSYSNTNGNSIDGGILRSNMKYVGTQMPDGSGSMISNPNAEINADGTLNTNPNPADASASGATYSGVITYLNKFSDDGYKGNDPASELFYESIRYFKKLGPTAEYLNGTNGSFPKLDASRWEDPIQYRCQNNFIVGMNDANPWKDKKLPGTHFACSVFNGKNISDDCGLPSSPDTDINVTTLTNKVGALEGLNGTNQYIGCTASACDMANTLKTIPNLGEVFGTYPYPAKDNSYYIAGLAYYANTQDIRDDLDGEQHIQTFMIDSQEYSSSPLTGPMNMLWLAGKYGGFTDENGDADPNNGTKPTHASPAISNDSTSTSEWDVDGDHEPDNYVLASQPEKLVQGLNQAFAKIISANASSSSAAANSTRLDTDTTIYQATFNSTNWTGSLLAYKFDSNGNLNSAPSWNAADKIPATSSRNIFTYDTDVTSNSYATGKTFLFSNLNNSQKQYLNNSALGITDNKAADRVSYLRGDQSEEIQNGGSFRNRDSRLGDIVHSNPLYVGLSDNYGYSVLSGAEGTSYINYRAAKQSTTPTLYYGANDGMLHAIDAETGIELFSYIPDAVFPNLNKLTSNFYGCDNNGCIDHQFFVDGAPIAADAYIDNGGTGTKWRTILLGTLGAGGKGIFALDISDSSSFAEQDVLWEFTQSYTPIAADLNTNFSVANNMGYALPQPSIVRVNYAPGGGATNTGKWVAVVSNGYESLNKKAVIYILDLETGAVLKEFDSLAGDAGSPNGMSSPAVVDLDGDKVADVIYAGDLLGNLWKIDISSSNPNNWEYAYTSNGKPAPLFVAKDVSGNRQPITVKPEASKHSKSGEMIYFGTGKYYAVNDQVVGSSPQIQTFYGLRDNGSTIASRTSLQKQEILSEATLSNFGIDVRVTSDNSVNYSTQAGWYLDLKSPVNGAEGERVISKALLRSGRVVFITLIPEPDPCQTGGSSWLMEMNAENGARLTTSPFDINGDGKFDLADYLALYDTNNDGRVDSNDATPISGQRIHGLGGANLGAVITSNDGSERKVVTDYNGKVKMVAESSDNPTGRKSWRQLR